MILNKKNKIKIVDKLNKLIADIECDKIRFELHFANGITKAGYRDLKYMANKKTVLLPFMFDTNRKPMKIEDSDIQVVIGKYNEVESKLNKYKALLEDLCDNKNKKENKKQYKEILDMDL